VSIERARELMAEWARAIAASNDALNMIKRGKRAEATGV
jgi:hypothetical protein